MEFNSSSCKRRRDSSSSSQIQPSKFTMRKLDFANDVFNSPPVINIDDNSCGTNWDNAENSNNSLENSFIDHTDSSSNDNVFNSPLSIVFEAQTRRRSTQVTVKLTTTTARKLLREKSKSDSFFGATEATKISESPSSHESIKKALETCAEHAAMSMHDDSERLVGDLSRKHTLPILRYSKHRDLASISGDTLVELIEGKYTQQIDEYSILDARYPYEYQGGHINGAESAYVKDQLFEKLFRDAHLTSKPKVLIIHCEFSSERGPKL